MPSRDLARRLDRKGRAQAARLPEALSGYEIERLVTSPYPRCVETLGSLARALDLPVEVRPELRPDASRRDIRRLLGRLPATALVCTHREVFETLFGGEIECEKGGAWLIELHGRRLTPTAYLSPSAVVARGRRTALV